MGAYSKWSCVRVQLHNRKNAYSMWAGYIIYIYISLYICIIYIYMCIYNIICMYGHGYSPRSGNHRWRNGAKVSEDVVHRGNCYDVIYNESGGPKNMGQLLVRPIQYVGFSSPLKDPGWGWLNHAETGKDTNLI